MTFQAVSSNVPLFSIRIWKQTLSLTASLILTLERLVVQVILFMILSGLLLLYVICLHRQLHRINFQLRKRLNEHTRQPLSLELFDRELNSLVSNINDSLKAEEVLRLKAVHDEKQFKELISNISHDLRTPLTALRGYQQLLEKESLSPDQSSKLRIAQKYADELGQLIHQFFEYSCLITRDVKPDLKLLNLRNLITEVLADSVNMLEQKNQTVRLEAKNPVFAYADNEMATRIFHNLIHNYITHSNGSLTVKVLEGRQTGIVAFSNLVDDPAAIDTSRIFERFYTERKAGGRSAGLGLSIVRLLADQMGGSAKAALIKNRLEIRVEFPACKAGSSAAG